MNIDTDIEPNVHSVEDTSDRIVDIIADAFHVEREKIFAKKRNKLLVEARFLIIYILREILGISFPMIAKYLNRDHTTIIYAHQKVSLVIKSNPNYKISIIRNITQDPYIQNCLNHINHKKLEFTSAHFPESANEFTAENGERMRMKQLAKKTISDRDFACYIDYKAGNVLETIAKKHGITRERGRQIIYSVVSILAARVLVINPKGPSVDKAQMIAKALHTAAKNLEKRRNEMNVKIDKEKRAAKWSRVYDYCIKCGSTKNKHFVNGLCIVCGKRSISGQEREEIIFKHNSKCDKCNITREECKKTFGRDFYLSREPSNVLCRKCFCLKTGTILGKRTRIRKFIPELIDNPRATFVYKNKLTHAYGAINEKNFIVLKNSCIDPSVRGSYIKYKKKVSEREILLKNYGELMHNSSYKLIEDIKFDSPSEAATFCGGGQTNGWECWRSVENGKTLNEIYKQEQLERGNGDEGNEDVRELGISTV